MVRLRAHDGHELDSYLAQPAARPRGAVVIAQEMYGVNAYLRAVCDFYASTAISRSRRRCTTGGSAE